MEGEGTVGRGGWRTRLALWFHPDCSPGSRAAMGGATGSRRQRAGVCRTVCMGRGGAESQLWGLSLHSSHCPL